VPRRSPAFAEATDLFLALGGVVKRLRHNPLPHQDALHAALHGAAPAPRHVTALLQVASETRIGVSDLADRLGVSLATASQLVTELAEWGLVERSTDDADRRRTFVTVAPAHQETISVLIESRLRPVERTLHRLEPDERAAMKRALVVLAEELDNATREAAR